MNNSKAAAKRTQVVLSAPEFIKIGTREKVCKNGKTIIVNRYKKNPLAKPIKTILHSLIPADGLRKAFNGFKGR